MRTSWSRSFKADPFPILYDLAHVSGWDQHNLHDLYSTCFLGSICATYVCRSCAASHNSRWGTRGSRSWYRLYLIYLCRRCELFRFEWMRFLSLTRENSRESYRDACEASDHAVTLAKERNEGRRSFFFGSLIQDKPGATNTHHNLTPVTSALSTRASS